MAPPVGSSSWRFHPRALALRPERSDRFVDRLAIALEAGHSLIGELHLRYRSGPRAGIDAETDRGNFGRWWSGRVVGLYAPGQWSIAPRTVVATGPKWRGRPARRFPAPLWGAPPTSLSERLGGVLSSLPGGLVLEVRMRPSATYTETASEGAGSTWRPSVSAPSVRQGRARPGPTALGSPPTQPAQRIWACQVSLYRTGAAAEVAKVEASAIERSLCGTGGNGVRFSRVRSWPFQGEGEFPVRNADLLALLPGPTGESWPIPEEVPPTGGRLAVGVDERGGPWAIAFDAANGRHMAVLGETGMGKSSFLVSVAAAAAREYGVILLDPMGDAARQFLAAIPPTLGSRVTWVSPAASPLGLNAIAPPARAEGAGGFTRRISDLVEALRRVRAGHFVERSFWGPRIEEMLARAVSAAASTGGTLVDAHTFLDGAMAGEPISAGATPELRALFERVRQRPEDAEGAKRLLFEFTSSPDLVRLLCERHPGIRARDLVAPQAITVVSGDAPQVGEVTTRRLLAAYLSILWGELMARPTPAKTFVVLDEIQWFGHEALGEMLRLGRRFNVHLVVGTQSLNALPEEMAAAIRTNVADFLVFRGSPDEAREFSRMAPALQAEDVLALTRGEAIYLEGKGRRVQYVRPALTRTEPRATGGYRTGGPAASFPTGRERVQRPSVRADPPSRAAAAPGYVDPPRSTGTIRIYLADLQSPNPDGESRIREWGGFLGRAGDLLGRGRDARGSYWELTEEGSRWLTARARVTRP